MLPETILKYFVVFIGSFSVSFLLIPLIRLAATKAGAVDTPGARRLNKTPVPRLGGLAVFAGFHFGCALIFLPSWSPFAGQLDAKWWSIFFPISLLILLIGAIDDFRALSPVSKLCGQISVATLLFFADFSFGRILGVPLPGFLDYLVTTTWYLTLINAFNLIDGLDGLAAGLACIGATGIAGAMFLLRQPGDALVLLSLVGSCLAFLRFNFYPAKIFLGDSGSMFLGLAFATIAISTSTKGTTVAVFGICLLAAGIPLLDTLLAIWRRSVRRMFISNTTEDSPTRVMGADMDHLHHRLLRSGLQQKGVALRLYTLSSVLVGMGLLTMMFSSRAVGIFVISFVLATYVVIRHLAHVELWDSGTAIVRGLKRPTTPVLAALLFPAIDFILLGASLAIAIFLVTHSAFASPKVIWLNLVAQWSSIPFIGLILAKTYKRVWSRARSADFVFLAVTLFISIALNLGITLVVQETSTVQLLKLAVAYFFVASLFIIGWRAIPRLVREIMASRQGGKASGNIANPQRLLIYGSGNRCSLYLKQIGYASIATDNRCTIVGLIDDERNLRKRIVFGFPVLGELSDLPTLLEELAIDRIIVACTLSPEKRERLLEIADANHVAISSWSLNTDGAPLPNTHERAA